MTKEEIIIHVASVTANEYAWCIHIGAFGFLVGARVYRSSWYHLLLIGATLLFIAVGGYSSAQVILPSVPEGNPVGGQLIVFQQVLLLAYGAVGAGLVTMGLTMNPNQAVD